MKTSRALLSWCLLAAAVIAPACGKKGPPLAPLMVAPARIADLSARRIGDTVYLTFTIPSTNATGTKPADLARVDVFGFTALSPSDVLDVRDMTPVASITVRKPPEPEPAPKAEKPPKPPKPLEPGEDQGALFTVTEALTPAMQTLTAGTRNPKKPQERWVTPVTTLLEDQLVSPPLVGVVPPVQPTRFYVAMGVSRRGVKAALSSVVGVTLQLVPPPAPAAPVLTVTEKAVGLVWEPPAGAPAPPYAMLAPAAVPVTAAAVAPPAPAAGAKPATTTPPAPPRLAAPATAPGETPAQAVAGATPATLSSAAAVPPPAPLAATPRGMMLPVLLGYNVYISGALVPPPAQPVPGAAPAAPVPISAGTPAPIPLNPAPLAMPTFQDTTFTFDTERCYEVRSVNALGVPAVHAANTPPIPGAPALPPAPPSAGPPRSPVVVLPPVWFESAPSVKTCVTPKDIFPPPVPPSLAAVGSVGVISLIWEGVEAADLAGYLVLRGQAPDGPMAPLFEAPIHETTWRDTTVKPGVRYVYAVVSVDTATTPNRSAPSNKAEETAR